MFGLFKKLFGRTASPPPAVQVTEEPVQAPAPPMRAAAPAPLPMRIPTESGDMLALPLNEILSRLPLSLTALILSRPGGTFSVPLNLALEQLRTGAVRIAFAQLRQNAPPGTFADNATHDDSLIDLPLPMILTAIGPSALARRPDQKQIEVPSAVTGVFEAGHGQFHRAMVAPSPRTAAPTPAPAAMRPVPPMPLPTAPKPTTSIGLAPAAPKPLASAPLPFTVPKPASPPTLAAPAPPGDNVVTTLGAVSGAWPSPVQWEIKQHNLEQALISIPLLRLDRGMKAGRVVVTWSEVGGWLSEPLPLSPHKDSQLELPLNVIAPLYLAKRRSLAPRKVLAVGADVPDVFASLEQPATPSAPVIPAPSIAAAPAPLPIPAAPAARHVLGEIFGQPSKANWTLEEIAQGILTLPGVSGALLAANDGLLVAGKLPAPLKAETLAAFLPQIFTRVSGCAEEVQLGTLRALTLMAGQTPCAIFKAGKLYLAVLGQPGQPLPEPALERIAGELPQAKP